MKWLIASDIHGSALYCRKLLERYKAESADRLLLLGDILYHGPRNDLPDGYAPKEVIAMLNEIKDAILCVRGNCDAEIDQMVLRFPVAESYAVIDTGERLIFATHGHVFNKENLPPMKKGDILLHGHTHVPCIETTGNCIYLNPGSISIPKNGSYHGYMTLKSNVFLWKDLDGNTINQYQT